MDRFGIERDGFDSAKGELRGGVLGASSRVRN